MNLNDKNEHFSSNDQIYRANGDFILKIKNLTLFKINKSNVFSIN